MLERSENNLTSQHDTYLRELLKVHCSLQEVHKTLASFDIPGTIGGQVMYLSIMLEERTRALEMSCNKSSIFIVH